MGKLLRVHSIQRVYYGNLLPSEFTSIYILNDVSPIKLSPIDLLCNLLSCFIKANLVLSLPIKLFLNLRHLIGLFSSRSTHMRINYPTAISNTRLWRTIDCKLFGENEIDQ